MKLVFLFVQGVTLRMVIRCVYGLVKFFDILCVVDIVVDSGQQLKNVILCTYLEYFDSNSYYIISVTLITSKIHGKILYTGC